MVITLHFLRQDNHVVTRLDSNGSLYITTEKSSLSYIFYLIFSFVEKYGSERVSYLYMNLPCLNGSQPSHPSPHLSH